MPRCGLRHHRFPDVTGCRSPESLDESSSLPTVRNLLPHSSGSARAARLSSLSMTQERAEIRVRTDGTNLSGVR